MRGNAFLLICFLFLVSCKNDKAEKKFKIGFSQCTGADNWRRATLDGLKRELSFHPGTELIYKNAQDNSDLQVKQIKELIAQGIDILLVSPNEAQTLTPVIEEAYNKGIPVVVIDRRISSDLYTSFVGSDNFEIGKMGGNYVASMVHGSANVIEVIGLQGSTPSSERQKGFAEAISINPHIHIKSNVYGNWLKKESSEELLKIKDQLSPNDIVFAQNDPMALGAYEVYKSLGMEKTARFIGVDGLPGPGGGIQFVSDKILKATLLNPTGGEEAIRIAFKILNKEPFNKENILPTVVIDSTNVRIMKLQVEKISSQQRDIERQQKMLYEQQRIYNNQRTLLYMSIAGFILVFILGSITFYASDNNRKINRRLALQNQEISDQRNQLIELAKKAKEASEAKINFFTNISHEFRTPLTLILTPLEEILSNSRLDHTTKQYISLIKKNSIRLLKLVSEILDFRKIETAKMQLQASENDIVQFMNDIISSFKALAKTRHIDLRLIAKERSINVWFDAGMLDKVIFNLLSNAFKFTNDDGFIYVSVEKSTKDNTVVIKVEDNGIGMSQDVSDHIFELFYQGNITDRQGSGLGLSLSKELIELHHGSIGVISEQGKETVFTIKLPLGKHHFSEDEFISERPVKNIMHYDERIFTREQDNIQAETENFFNENKSDNTILVIEDNNDLRNYLFQKLKNHYQVIEADNGTNAIKLAFDNVPDLIISDVALPGKDGLVLTNILKSDIRTSHIPVILLTAKSEMHQQIEGMKSMADAYIIKPFNFQFLEETIRSVMKNREILREHYTNELPVALKSQTPKKLDKKFINDFTAIVESNLGNDKFNVDEICKIIGISRIQLYRKVKALLGCNVNDYIVTVRLHKAKYLLNESDMSISEIAYKVGFSSSAYFSTVFKSKINVTPSEFREKNIVR